MSLFRRSSAAVVSAATASTSRSRSLPITFCDLLQRNQRSQLPAATAASFSTSLAQAYPRTGPMVAQPKLASLSAEPNARVRRPTTTVEFEEPSADATVNGVDAEAAALGQQADARAAVELRVELPAEMDETQAVKFENMLSRHKIQKYNKTHVFCRHIPHGIDNNSLVQAFEGAGIPVLNARILAYPRRDGRFVSRGYGWVSLRHEKDMRNALRLDGMKINDIPIQIEQMRQRPFGSFDRPPKPEPEMPPGYYLRLPPSSSRRAAREFLDDGSTGYGVIGGSPGAGGSRGSSKFAATKWAGKQSRAANNKRFGPRPGDRESDVDWAGWQGQRRTGTSSSGQREEAELVSDGRRSHLADRHAR